MQIFAKIIDFLTASLFDDETYENKQLYRELNKKINKIKRDNKTKIIETSIKPFLKAEYFKNNNMLMTEKELNSSAEYEFNYAKKMGFIDDLNNIRI